MNLPSPVGMGFVNVPVITPVTAVQVPEPKRIGCTLIVMSGAKTKRALRSSMCLSIPLVSCPSGQVTLDFDAFSNQKWDRLHESHAKDIVVTWPDGHETKGIDKHIEDLKALFVFAPDITIKVHPIRFGSGTWTAVTGVMTGTFAKPMPTGDGKFIQPTGRRFVIAMADIGRAQ